MKGPYRELIPSPPQTVRVKLPAGAAAKDVRLLVAGQAPATRRDGEMLSVVVPSILDHEVVAIDL